MDIGGWLKRLGLERYESVFAANDVDFDVLRMLSEKDLQDLGLSLGHRKKLLKALSELDAPVTSGGQASVAPVPSVLSMPSSSSAEARNRLSAWSRPRWLWLRQNMQ